MRPAYLPAVVLVLLVAGLRPLGSWKWRQQGLAVGLVLAGMSAAAAPQVAINHNQRGGITPRIPRAGDIALVQLSGGLIAQRYETYVGPPEDYPRAKIVYYDPAGTRVLEDEGAGDKLTSYGEYVRIALGHPLLMTASYTLHLFNGLDVRYPTPYIRDIGYRRWTLSLLGYALVFLAILRLVVPTARRALGSINWLGVLLLVSATASAIPAVAEPRFFLPLHALVYMLVCFGPRHRTSFTNGTAGRRVALFATCAAFIAICLTLSEATDLQHEKPGPVSRVGI
jgi:hypothetical protein